jgi:hypothetical protein
MVTLYQQPAVAVPCLPLKRRASPSLLSSDKAIVIKIRISEIKRKKYFQKNKNK